MYSLPLVLSKEHSLVITVASKERSPYVDPDFRFIRLIAGLLSSKLSQLLLLQSLEIKNDELAEVNDELHALNEEITRLNLFLEEKVTERTTALQGANQELNTIFYRTSHDFRRPLTTILGLANVARHIDDISEMRQLFTYAEEAVGDLMRMMEKLKDLSHLAEDSVENSVPTDFEEILDRIIVRYSSLIKTKSIDISLVNQLQVAFHAPEGLLYAILENLLENAILFSGENPRIEITLLSRDQAMVVQVQDNGQGIRCDYLDKVFHMYTRANESTKGNGLGLYVVKKLTDRLNGQIDIRSELGLGTTVCLQFPVQ
jgi:signal transduction histidine kinase